MILLIVLLIVMTYLLIGSIMLFQQQWAIEIFRDEYNYYQVNCKPLRILMDLTGIAWCTVLLPLCCAEEIWKIIKTYFVGDPRYR